MIYLYPSSDSFSIFHDKTTLPEEYHGDLIEVESLPDGDGVLKRGGEGVFYYEPFPVIPEPSPEPDSPETQPTLDEMQAQTLLNTEYLVIMSELTNL